MHDEYIDLIIKEAKKAYKKNEVPVGCIIIKNGKILAKTHNLIECKKDSTCHAEIIAIKKASRKIKNWRLLDCEMYVTLEPCDMCKEVIKSSRIKQVYYILSKKEKKSSKENNIYNCLTNKKEEYNTLLKTFFNNIR